MVDSATSYLDPAVTSNSPMQRLWGLLRGLFLRPARLQIAALCHRMREGQLEVLLVASRGTKRWILPKGWPELDHRSHRTAVIEAFEEAGVTGKVSQEPFGRFRSTKGLDSGLRVNTDVLVFLIEAQAQAEDYPEAGERECRWLPIAEAIKLASEPGLVDILKRLQRDRVTAA